MAVLQNEDKSCFDAADREINCTLTIDVAAMDTCGYRALELAQRYRAAANAYRREARWLFTCSAVWFAISAAIWFAM